MPSNIEWTGESWNPIRARTPDGKVGWHCEHASPGCQHCYAETQNIARRFDLGTGLPYKPGHRKDVETFLDEAALLKPLGWKKPRTIFVCSMTDLFGDFVTDAMIDRVFAVMALCPQHTFQVLTKRSARMREYFGGPGARRILWRQAIPDSHAGKLVKMPLPLPNVWLGVSVEDQQRADERIPDLLATPAALRWISAEPLLGPVDLTDIPVVASHLSGLPKKALPQITARELREIVEGDDQVNPTLSCLETDERWSMTRFGKTRIDWVVAGGESGKDARPMHPDWPRALRDQCAAANVPFFFKQWGQWLPGFDECPPFARGWRVIGDEGFASVGKAKAGRLLDGIEHNAMPGQG